jgi:hypothetical protein
MIKWVPADVAAQNLLWNTLIQEGRYERPKLDRTVTRWDKEMIGVDEVASIATRLKVNTATHCIKRNLSRLEMSQTPDPNTWVDHRIHDRVPPSRSDDGAHLRWIRRDLYSSYRRFKRAFYLHHTIFARQPISISGAMQVLDRENHSLMAILMYSLSPERVTFRMWRVIDVSAMRYKNGTKMKVIVLSERKLRRHLVEEAWNTLTCLQRSLYPFRISKTNVRKQGYEGE